MLPSIGRNMSVIVVIVSCRSSSVTPTKCNQYRCVGQVCEENRYVISTEVIGHPGYKNHVEYLSYYIVHAYNISNVLQPNTPNPVIC